MKNFSKVALSALDAVVGAVLLVDRKGRILFANDFCRRVLGTSPNHLLKQNLIKICQTPDQIKRILKETKSDSLWDFYDKIKIQSPGNVEILRMLRIRAQIFKPEPHLFLFLILPGYGVLDPYRQILLSLTSAADLPYLVLDSQDKIIAFNHLFLDAGRISETKQTAIRGQELHTILNKRSAMEMKAKREAQAYYLNKISKNSRNPWVPLYEEEIAVKNNWTPSPFCRFQYHDKEMVLSTLKSHDFETFCIFSKPVNFYGMDFKIEYQCRSPNPKDLSCIIGSGRMGLESDPAKNGYFFGFGSVNNVLNFIQRKGVILSQTTNSLPRPNRNYRVEISRVGTRFSFRIDEKEILNFIDPNPLLGPDNAFLSLYTFTRDSVFFDIRIFQKKSLLVLEKLWQFQNFEMTFETNPAQIFSARQEPIQFESESAQLVTFRHILFQRGWEGKHRGISAETNEERLEKIKKYLDETLDRSINFKELSKMASMSYSKFFSVFKAKFGLSPADYHLNMKIKRAKTLLATNRYKINEIAFMLGYNDDRPFHRIFKKKTGQTPLQYQKTFS